MVGGWAGGRAEAYIDEQPLERCGTRRNVYETGARGLQRDSVQGSQPIKT